MDSELTCAVRGLAVASRALERALDDMTLPQFRVLALIETSPERASHLAEMAAVSRPSLTGLLDGLEARSWVRRVDVAGDRRGVKLEVTASGKRALRHAEKAMSQRLEDVLGDLNGADRAKVLEGLGILRGRFVQRVQA